MKHLSLFSGIGGFDLAAEWMGWENIAHCEWNSFGQRVLKYYWPNAISYHDITKTDFTIHRGTIDIVTGGFPCQPYSVAGKRKGKDDERHLWPEMLRAIREIQPRWVVGENVGGLLSWNGGLVFNEVQADLEAEGYEILPFLLPAAGVNAPHRRDRIWFVAYSNNSGTNSSMRGNGIRQEENENRKRQPQPQFRADGINGTTTHANDKGGSSGFGEVSKEDGEISQWDYDAEPCNTGARFAETTHCDGCRSNIWEKESKVRGQRNFSSRDNERVSSNNEQIGIVTDTNRRRQSGKEHREEKSGFIAKESIPDDWQNFPTQSPVCNGDDEFPTELLRQRIREDCMGVISEKEIDQIISKANTQWRNETIKSGGNAVVSRLVLQIFKAIEQYENLTQ